MAWTTPRTYADGETLTTTILNQDWRDNLLALLTVPACKMRGAVATSIPNSGVDTLVTLDTSVFDTDTMADTTNKRIVVKTAGKYLVGFAAQFQSEATPAGFRRFKLQHHRGAATTEIGRWQGPPNASGNAVGTCISALYDCAVNDYFDAVAAHTGTAATINVNANNPFSPFLFAFRVGT